MPNYTDGEEITSAAFNDLLSAIKTEFQRRKVTIKTSLVNTYYNNIKNNTLTGITAGETPIMATKVNEVLQLIKDFKTNYQLAATSEIINDLSPAFDIITKLKNDSTGDTTCVAMCMGLCSGCGSGCSGGCNATSRYDATSTSCGTCGSGCTSSCGGECTGCTSCSTACGQGCSHCSSSCGAACERACSDSCKGGCHNACRNFCTFEVNTHPY